jgi:malonate-semialdehyde dehydrogenase (acetylating)/methylmalonate-semialdehyde dehydrogenase
MQIIENAIGGKLTISGSDRRSPVFNPATGEQIAELPLSTVEEINAAVANAKAAQPAWGDMPPLKRARFMFKFKELLDRHATTSPARFPPNTARPMTMRWAKCPRHRGGRIRLRRAAPAEGRVLPQCRHRRRQLSPIRQPLGVVAGITPFNFPAMVPMWMYPIAVACGNTFILKPSERDPVRADAGRMLFQKPACPEGVLNVVHGDKEAVDALLTIPTSRRVSFVGSTPIAEYIYSTGTAHGKRVQALGGAKNHMVIMPDADMDRPPTR